MNERDERTAEERRLAQDDAREANWKRWGPYLSERQWGTVREDYSADGSAWEYFPHDHARSRAYRWGEDGLLGFTDRQCRLCFGLALWNGRDPILKERLFGLTGPQGNHGEDVKECYYYLDSTPTHSYAKALYKYPQSEFPYQRLVEENARRSREEGEFELADAAVFADGRYFDVQVEYAKGAPDDILIRVTVSNRGPEAAAITVLPTLWFRNTWSWGRGGEEHGPKPMIEGLEGARVRAHHDTLGVYELAFGADPGGRTPELVFTDNESNSARLWNIADGPKYAKDAFHAYVVEGRVDAVDPGRRGTKTAAIYRLEIPAGGAVVLAMRLAATAGSSAPSLGADFERTFSGRIAEADQFFAARVPGKPSPDEQRVIRQAYAGLLWSKQFYHYIVPDWIGGDPAHPPPPPSRAQGRNHEWSHLYNRDVISMPDKWEYPWYAAWDLAFHMLPFARIDTTFAKQQLELFLREWYMHPNGQIPAYEWALGDVNPPVHAWACWRVYKKSGPPGKRDRRFLVSAFQKLLLNFTWWVNRKDSSGRHIFAGGFLGLDNIGVFDRSAPMPGGGRLDQADGTAWMAFYCGTMLSIAFELAKEDPAHEDMASKFFEHFVAIVDAMNSLGGSGLWDPEDGFYYDQMTIDGASFPLKLRSLVGIIPLLAVEILDQQTIDRLPGFKKRMEWFLENRRDLAQHIGTADGSGKQRGRRLLTIPSRERLESVLRYLFDEKEFLSPYGIRSLSRRYEETPYELELAGTRYSVRYTPAESNTGVFGGNSNWRGPIWFPINFLLVEALERYHHYYGDDFKVEFPTGSGHRVTLSQAARAIASRLASLFLTAEGGGRPCHGDDARYADDPHWRDLVLFHEYFHAESGRGVGASHQTGWTALAALLVEELGKNDSGIALTATNYQRRPGAAKRRR